MNGEIWLVFWNSFLGLTIMFHKFYKECESDLFYVEYDILTVHATSGSIKYTTIPALLTSWCLDMAKFWFNYKMSTYAILIYSLHSSYRSQLVSIKVNGSLLSFIFLLEVFRLFRISCFLVYPSGYLKALSISIVRKYC